MSLLQTYETHLFSMFQESPPNVFQRYIAYTQYNNLAHHSLHIITSARAEQIVQGNIIHRNLIGMVGCTCAEKDLKSVFFYLNNIPKML